MATHLVSLLSDVEQALTEGSTLRWGIAWNLTRAVNEPHLVGRIALTPPSGGTTTTMRGAIFLQGTALPDGSMRFTASFHWHGSEAFPVVPVAMNSHALGWKAEAARIAGIWLAGPPVTSGAPGITDSASPIPLAG